MDAILLSSRRLGMSFFRTVALLLCACVPVVGATLTAMPTPFQTALDSNGNPINNAKICTYAAGTTTPIATYTDVGGLTPNTNPIRADSAGRFTAWLSQGTSYKFIYQDASGTNGVCDGVTYRTIDNISAVPGDTNGVNVIGTAGETLSLNAAVYLSDGSGGKSAGLWYLASNANAYSSVTPVIGMATTTIATASAGTIRVAGLLAGLTSLTPGAFYYVGTAGAITTAVPGSNVRVLGQADASLTSLVVGLQPSSSAFGTTGTLAKFTTPSTLGTSLLSESGSTLTYTGALGVTGAATVGTTLGVTGNVTVGGTLGVTGAASLSSISSLLNVTAFGAHTISAGGAGTNSINLRNTSAGTANSTQLNIGNDSSATLAILATFSSTFTTSGYNFANGTTLISTGVGGISLVASDAAGVMRVYTGGTNERMRISATGGGMFGTTTDPGPTSFNVGGTVTVAYDGTNGYSSLTNSALIINTSVAAGFAVNIDTNGLEMKTWPTTASAANAHVGNIDQIRLVTSLRSAKHDIAPIALSEARRTVMGLQAVLYESAVDVDQRPWAGFIADDVEKVNPILAAYDEKGHLQSVTYDRVPAFLLPVVQDHEARLAALEKALAAK